MRCPDCGVQPGQRHHSGCDQEQCRVCGKQLIGCDCIYEVFGWNPETLEQEHPWVYRHGPTQVMYEHWDQHVAKLGGPIPYSGEYRGVAECREYGWYTMPYTDEPVAPETPGATEDLNRLHRECIWIPTLAKFAKPGPSS